MAAYGKYQSTLHGIIFGFGFYGATFDKNLFLYSVKISSDGNPVIKKVATLPANQVQPSGSFDIPVEWIGLEISSNEILIFDGVNDVTPVICDLSSTADISVSSEMKKTSKKSPTFIFFCYLYSSLIVSLPQEAVTTQ